LGFVNVRSKEVQVKIVYYGTGRGGKTTNLEFVNRNYQERIKSKMVSLKTHGDRTLFFDFLPFDMGKIKGYDVKIQLYTVPGQVKYNATRRIVLKGVDGLVFVADAQKEQRQKNIDSLNQLFENLATYNLDLYKIPFVMQYNKMDMDKDLILPVEVLQRDLNSRLKAPAFMASAINGGNVVATLKKIISLTMVSVQNELL
jgi:hypothetical protein